MEKTKLQSRGFHHNISKPLWGFIDSCEEKEEPKQKLLIIFCWQPFKSLKDDEFWQIFASGQQKIMEVGMIQRTFFRMGPSGHIIWIFF